MPASLSAGRLRPIERTSASHNQKPYLPGSSLKGAIRTAILNHLAQSNFNANGREDRLLGGSFETDPLRLLKISDAMVGEGVEGELTHICDNQNRHRKDGTTTSIHDRNQPDIFPHSNDHIILLV